MKRHPCLPYDVDRQLQADSQISLGTDHVLVGITSAREGRMPMTAPGDPHRVGAQQDLAPH